MGSDKDQIDLPKSVACKSAAVKKSLGKLRLQTYKDKDEIHVHDDEEGLRFVYKGKRAFQLGIDAFLKTQHFFMPGELCKVVGIDNADLILERKPEQWEMYLSPKGKTDTKHVLCDEILIELDEFIQRI